MEAGSSIWKIPCCILILVHLNIHAVHGQLPLADFAPPLGNITVYSDSNKSEILAQLSEQPTMYNFADTAQDVEGYLVAADPPNACDSISQPPADFYPDFPFWIVVVTAEGECSYDRKIGNAIIAGYDAIIITNMDSNETEVLPHSEQIPAFFVGEYEGSRLLEFSFPFPPNFVNIERADLFWGRFRAYSVWTSVLVAIVGVGGYILFLLIRAANCGVRLGRTCGVCRESLPRREGNSMLARLHVLPCKHKFHAFCMMPYSSPTGMSCPTCSKTFSYDSQRSDRDKEYQPRPRPSIVESSSGDSPTSSTSATITISSHTHSSSNPQRIERTIVELHSESGSLRPRIFSTSSAGDDCHGMKFKSHSDEEPLLPPKSLDKTSHKIQD